ncbi:hypothetical protein BH11PAT3_BH11PAT3_1810 [soil metagenome]
MTQFLTTKSCIHDLPDDLDLGVDGKGKKIEMSCHILADACCVVFGFSGVVTGKFLQMWEHTWITTRSGNIVDVYPPGIASGPILMDGSVGMLTRRVYTPWSLAEVESYFGEMFRSEAYMNAVRITQSALARLATAHDREVIREQIA